MADIWIALSTMFCAFVALFFLGQRVGARVRPRTANYIAMMTVILIFAEAFLLRDSVILAKLFPFSSLIILGNWLPLGVAFLAGLGWARMPRRAWRKVLLILPMLLLSLFASYGSLFAQTPRGANRWNQGVSVQTTLSTCGAASAATLLRALRIPASEREMIDLCLTRRQGTPLHGMYRGLKLKTAGSAWDVELISDDLDRLLAQFRFPVILSVGLDRPLADCPHALQMGGWEEGVRHAVVLLGVTPEGNGVIGDPQTGREVWTHEELRLLYRGRALRAVESGSRRPGFYASILRFNRREQLAKVF